MSCLSLCVLSGNPGWLRLSVASVTLGNLPSPLSCGAFKRAVPSAWSPSRPSMKVGTSGKSAPATRPAPRDSPVAPVHFLHGGRPQWQEGVRHRSTGPSPAARVQRPELAGVSEDAGGGGGEQGSSGSAGREDLEHSAGTSPSLGSLPGGTEGPGVEGKNLSLRLKLCYPGRDGDRLRLHGEWAAKVAASRALGVRITGATREGSVSPSVCRITSKLRALSVAPEGLRPVCAALEGSDSWASS